MTLPVFSSTVPPPSPMRTVTSPTTLATIVRLPCCSTRKWPLLPVIKPLLVVTLSVDPTVSSVD